MQVLLTDYAWSDLDIERRMLSECGATLVVAPQADTQTLARLAVDADAIMTCWAQVTAEVLDACPRCQIVARLGIGLDNIDVGHCTRRGIPVTNVPDYCTVEVAEHTLALVLSLARKTAFYHAQTKSGQYDLKQGAPLQRLRGRTLGIVGMGRIGTAVAELARAVGLCVSATPHRRPLPADIQSVEWDQLLRKSDFLSLHLPLTSDTRGLIGERELAVMKPTACLINTARGGLVDHAALAAAIDSGRLAGAALDVQDPEPPDMSQPPFCLPQVLVTPHAAFASEESLRELRTRVARQVVDRLSGRRPECLVNPEVLR